MSKYYQIPIKIISIITLAAFALTNTGMSYAWSQPSNLRQTSIAQNENAETGLASAIGVSAAASGRQAGETGKPAIKNDADIQEFIREQLKSVQDTPCSYIAACSPVEACAFIGMKGQYYDIYAFLEHVLSGMGMVYLGFPLDKRMDKVYVAKTTINGNDYLWIGFYGSGDYVEIPVMAEIFMVNGQYIAHGFSDIGSDMVGLRMGVDTLQLKHKGHMQILFAMKQKVLMNEFCNSGSGRKTFIVLNTIESQQVSSWDAFFFYVRRGYLPVNPEARKAVIEKFLRPWLKDPSYIVSDPDREFGFMWYGRCGNLELPIVAPSDQHSDVVTMGTAADAGGRAAEATERIIWQRRYTGDLGACVGDDALGTAKMLAERFMYLDYFALSDILFYALGNADFHRNVLSHPVVVFEIRAAENEIICAIFNNAAVPLPNGICNKTFDSSSPVIKIPLRERDPDGTGSGAGVVKIISGLQRLYKVPDHDKKPSVTWRQNMENGEIKVTFELRIPLNPASAASQPANPSTALGAGGAGEAAKEVVLVVTDDRQYNDKVNYNKQKIKDANIVPVLLSQDRSYQEQIQEAIDQNHPSRVYAHLVNQDAVLQYNGMPLTPIESIDSQTGDPAEIFLISV